MQHVIMLKHLMALTLLASAPRVRAANVSNALYPARSMTGVNIMHVSYKGTVLALTDLMAEHINVEAAKFAKVLREAGAKVN